MRPIDDKIKLKENEPKNLEEIVKNMEDKEKEERVYSRKEKRKIMNQKVQCRFCCKYIKRKNSLYHNDEKFFICRPCYEEIKKKAEGENNLR